MFYFLYIDLIEHEIQSGKDGLNFLLLVFGGITAQILSATP